MFGGSEAAGEKAELLGAADGTGYGWLAEEDTNRRKTEKRKKKRGAWGEAKKKEKTRNRGRRDRERSRRELGGKNKVN